MPSSSIIQTILRDQNISNFSAVPDERKLEIYKLALGKIRDGLVARTPREVAKATLITYEDALNMISVGFHYLKTTVIGRKFKLDKVVIPAMDKSLAYISRALSILERSKEKNLEYGDCIIQLRGKIIDVCNYL